MVGGGGGWVGGGWWWVGGGWWVVKVTLVFSFGPNGPGLKLWIWTWTKLNNNSIEIRGPLASTNTNYFHTLIREIMVYKKR